MPIQVLGRSGEGSSDEAAALVETVTLIVATALDHAHQTGTRLPMPEVIMGLLVSAAGSFVCDVRRKLGAVPDQVLCEEFAALAVAACQQVIVGAAAGQEPLSSGN